MNDAPIQIRNPEVVRAIRRLAEKRGRPITDTLGELVGAELDRLERVDEAEVQRRLRAVEDIVRRFNALPVVGPLLTDDDLYDEDGLPR
jgi:hypothetical protein